MRSDIVAITYRDLCYRVIACRRARIASARFKAITRTLSLESVEFDDPYRPVTHPLLIAYSESRVDSSLIYRLFTAAVHARKLLSIIMLTVRASRGYLPRTFSPRRALTLALFASPPPPSSASFPSLSFLHPPSLIAASLSLSQPFSLRAAYALLLFQHDERLAHCHLT